MRPLGLYSTDTQQALGVAQCLPRAGWLVGEKMVRLPGAGHGGPDVAVGGEAGLHADGRHQRQIKPVCRAAFNPPRPRPDGDLAYIRENWPQIASAAWAGYLAQGRGLTIVDTRKIYPVPTGLGHAISYLPAGMVTAVDDVRMVREVVVGMLGPTATKMSIASAARGSRPSRRMSRRRSSETGHPVRHRFSPHPSASLCPSPPVAESWSLR